MRSHAFQKNPWLSVRSPELSSKIVGFHAAEPVRMQARGNKDPCTLRHRFMGERVVRCRAGIYPPAFFFPGPAESIPQG